MIKLLPPSPTGKYYLRWQLPEADALTDDTAFYVGGVLPSPFPGDNALLTFSVTPDMGKPAALTADEVRRVMLHRHNYEVIPVNAKGDTPTQMRLF